MTATCHAPGTLARATRRARSLASEPEHTAYITCTTSGFTCDAFSSNIFLIKKYICFLTETSLYDTQGWRQPGWAWLPSLSATSTQFLSVIASVVVHLVARACKGDVRSPHSLHSIYKFVLSARHMHRQMHVNAAAEAGRLISTEP